MIKSKVFAKIILGVNALTLILVGCLYLKNDISLGYFLLLGCMVFTMSITGFAISKIFEIQAQNTSYKSIYDKLERRIRELEAWRTEKTDNGSNFQDVLNITQSQLGNHISSVNTSLLVMSIICVFITIAIPILNYAFLSADQIKNMYQIVDNKLETGVNEIQEHVNIQLLDMEEEINANMILRIDRTVEEVDAEIERLNKATIYQTRMNSVQYLGFDDRINEYEQLLKEYPDNADIYYGMGYCQYLQEKYSDAIYNLEKSKELGYSNIGFLNRLLCYCYEYTADYLRVIEICNEQIPRDDDYYSFRETRAKQYVNLGLFDQAEAEYLKIIDELEAMGVHSSIWYESIGNFYKEWEKYDEAIKWYNKGLEKDAKGFSICLNRGKTYYNMGDYEEALRDFNQVIALGPDSFLGYWERSRIYMEQKEYYLALDDLDKMLAISPPDWSDPYNQRGLVHLYLGDYKKAIDDFRLAIAKNHNSSAIYYNLAFAYQKIGNLDAALRYISKAIEIMPESKEYYIFRADL